ncbi:MAG: rod shape-determining protein MreC [Patescibacteria group bacterium]
MNQRQSWILGLIIALLALVVLVEPSLGWRLAGFIYNGGDGSDAGSALENAALKAELARLAPLEKYLVSQPPRNFLQVPIYSRSPFNFKNEILVAGGESAGLKVGAPVAIALPGENQSGPLIIIIGKVLKVFEDTAMVQTVFDSHFRLGVRVGKAGAEALLLGGGEPKVGLIPREEPVEKGEAVYAAGADFPNGAELGELGDVNFSSEGLFKEAPLKLPYDFNRLQVVSIIIK